MHLQVIVALVALASSLAAQTPGQLTLADRFRYHALATAGPLAAFTGSASAGIRQWLDAPPEWGQGMEGFGRRLGYCTADRAAKNAIEFAAGALLREDPRYFRSREHGAGARIRHALVRTFLVPNENGATSFAYARVMGAYGGGFVSNLWRPQRLSNPGHAVLRGSVMLAGEAGGNVFREFWKKLRRKHP
jgi:hypothetical protein